MNQNISSKGKQLRSIDRDEWNFILLHFLTKALNRGRSYKETPNLDGDRAGQLGKVT